MKIEQLVNKNKKLKSELDYEKKKFKELQNKKINNYYLRLDYEKLRKLNKKIKTLKEKLKRYPFELLKGEQLISVIFNSDDQEIKYSFICKNTDTFIKLEEELYKVYPKYKNSKNFFTCNGKRINEFDSLKVNGIKNNSIIILNQI